ncbi:invasion protein IalB [Bradyrhizobium sp. LM6.9]
MSSKPDSLLKPREMFRTFTLTGLAALLAATALTAATPAQAQIGTIFSDPAAAAAARQHSAWPASAAAADPR